MPFSLGVVMDPIVSIKPAKDSTLAMLLEAQRRGCPIYYMEQRDLYLNQGACRARMRRLAVRDQEQDWFVFLEEQDCALDELDVVLMRKDPPFDVEYVYTTHLLELAERRGTLVVNRPRSLRDANEKLFITHFPELIPPTLVTREGWRIREFLARQGDIIVKPLGGMGGESIFRIGPNDPNISVIIETLTAQGTGYSMAQRFIPEISAGDKRLLMVNGKPVPYVLARMPSPGETRGNLAAGGKGVGRPLSSRDHEIAAKVGPVLLERGILFAGLDVIGDWLTEINITSPTCIRELDRQFGINIAGDLMDAIEERLASGPVTS
ncbi:MAG: glutathione synthase [Gammaproteobacteria bacterium]|nr:glutathione synthase [Gammaproteobacteria bacterium]MBU1654865.1 glutathione synthase [Gammaproteobacteria bacterium]MBU1961156.1 glutathione synthase [Gammaproteobacteria bacterium]